jgi:hypothetical protein
LRKLGIDIHADATEEKIAQLVKYPAVPKEGGAYSHNIHKAFQHYGFDYISVDTIFDPGKIVTIDDIDRITKQGHVVVTGVCKPNIGGHFLLIEQVTRTENGDRVTLYDPYYDEEVTLPYEELEKVLDGTYTLPSEKQRETWKPILKDNRGEVPLYLHSMVPNEENIHIYSMLPESSSIMAIRRGLNKLGIDIKADATEIKIAQLVEYPYSSTTEDALMQKIVKAYQYYNLDYIFRPGLVTIDEVASATQHSHGIHVVEAKLGGGEQSLLIEKGRWTEDGYHVTFYNPDKGKRETLPYEQLENRLLSGYILPSEEEMKKKYEDSKQSSSECVTKKRSKLGRIFACLQPRAGSRW